MISYDMVAQFSRSPVRKEFNCDSIFFLMPSASVLTAAVWAHPVGPPQDERAKERWATKRRVLSSVSHALAGV